MNVDKGPKEGGGQEPRGIGSWLRRGFLDSLPFAPGVLAWGAIFGAAALVSGLSRTTTVLMSAVVFSGTAQLAVLKILALPALSIFATSLLLSLRFLPMSLVLNRHLGLPRWQRLLISCTVVDASFALAARRTWRAGGLAPYLAGVWLSTYSTWLGGTLLGALFGSILPPGWARALEGFTVVIFVVLTAELCTSRHLGATAVLGGAVGLALTSFLPIGIAMVLAAFISAALMASWSRVRR